MGQVHKRVIEAVVVLTIFAGAALVAIGSAVMLSSEANAVYGLLIVGVGGIAIVVASAR